MWYLHGQRWQSGSVETHTVTLCCFFIILVWRTVKFDFVMVLCDKTPLHLTVLKATLHRVSKNCVNLFFVRTFTIVNMYIQCESKKSLLRTCVNFSKAVGNFSTKFYVPIMRSHLRLTTIFLSNYLQLWRNYAILSVTTQFKSCAQKCSPSAETHAGIFWHFSRIVRNF